jgi:hypothetical protein
MTTAAAIDRLVHHAVIIEIDRGSVRAEEAKRRNTKKEKDRDETWPSKRTERHYPNALRVMTSDNDQDHGLTPRQSKTTDRDEQPLGDHRQE